jgi:hypothetical protein
MKKISVLVLFSLFLVCSDGISQNFYNTFDASTASVLLRKKEDKGNVVINGSAYGDEKFLLSSIKNVNEKLRVRYNLYKDEIEVLGEKDEVLLLPKDTLYNQIRFMLNTNAIDYLGVNDINTAVSEGYYYNLNPTNKKVTLYKKTKVVLVSEKHPVSSYDVYEPAKYVKGKDQFYIKMSVGNMIDFPKSKKELIALYPSKKAEVEAYFKENKVSFKDEKDMVKITNFIGTL